MVSRGTRLNDVHVPQASAAPPTLQESQTNALLTLLNLNNPADSSTPSQTASKGSSLKVASPTGPPVWKVLVLDQYTKDVLATVLRVQDLRDVGVTLHVYVHISVVNDCVLPQLQATAFKPTPTTRRSRCLLRLSQPSQRPTDITRPRERPLRVIPSELCGTITTCSIGRVGRVGCS